MFLSKYWAKRTSSQYITKCSIERYQSWIKYCDSGFSNPKLHAAYIKAHARHNKAVEAHLLLLKG